jgi:putative radical SAM enzyme (TIGR03279 family)
LAISLVKPPGVSIKAVRPGSPAEQAGLRPGMRLLALNGAPARDSIDLMFHGAEERLALDYVDRRGRRRGASLRKRLDEDLGLEIEEFQPRRCRNRCVFCFVDQNPPGLRKPIYFKDGDFRLSFLHGAYITGTNLSREDRARIVEQRLSPLYISVHATNPQLRLRLLGVTKASPILDELRFLTRNGIQVHAQIVVCPGWNDGAELERTARDLAALGENLLSIAVVPAGLTEHRTGLPKLKPVTRRIAEEVLRKGRRLQRELHAGRDEPLLFYADEWFLRAGRRWPQYDDPEMIHQLENGVRMCAAFYEGFGAFGRNLPRKVRPRRRVAVLTGKTGARVLAPAIERLRRIDGLTLSAIPLANSLFGRPVTVSGLLSGQDFLRAILENPAFDRYLLPANALRDEDDVFLDDVTLEQLRAKAKGDVIAVHGGAVELARAALDGL